ncbi:ribonuclease H2 catalytic subunit RNH201 [Aspergillus affinis]|uniref:ribonuclease H2 catalytic subunit RNH201 n=1 Tax=Aspergillus affinis TaxID=1070780 RepID=UPI0022FF0EE8|nr:ribonuclease H2 subunit A [Aspergillus affinis]KAI9041535.1 ribonuclease H2 subunit A [Aspergillus affinis]
MEEPTERHSPEGFAPTGLFIPPSIDRARVFAGESYAHYSPCPPETDLQVESSDPTKPPSRKHYVLGVDEAGRGPVLGPMVYSAFYVPHDLHHPLLAQQYSFDDSKVLTPAVRANLMQTLCTPGTPLFESCGWATKLLSARDISSGMMRLGAGAYNLNAQAMDATIELIRDIVEVKKVEIREVYIDTIGNPAAYQQKLERIFPSLRITVAKKADSLYPCVSAASVAAKVTRDVALELCHHNVLMAQEPEKSPHENATNSWGSGYPSDSKCVRWLRGNMEPIFGWGNECRFSWGTAKEMLELKGGSKVDWPVDGNNSHLKEFMLSSSSGGNGGTTSHELEQWFGSKPTEVL